MATPMTLRSSYGRILPTRPSTAGALTLSIIRAPSNSAASFSTTAPVCKRKGKVRGTNRDNNKQRGVSSIWRSGPKQLNSMSHIPLPQPVHFKPKVKVDPNHGLWGFFAAPEKLLMTPEETEKHGRPWTVEELRKKSWEDLHSLWWVCCRERNMIATALLELERSEMGFGKMEFEKRDESVRKTMGAIRHALAERYYTWEDAQEVAREDSEIDLQAAEGQAYNPSSAYEPEEFDVKKHFGETKESKDGVKLD